MPQTIVQRDRTQRPTGMTLLALIFIFAPIGNLIVNAMWSGTPHWYEPTVFMQMLRTIPQVDWLWLGLVELSGFLLLKPHKTTWVAASLCLNLVLLVNIYRVFCGPEQGTNFGMFYSIISFAGVISVFLFAIYFRFPYLDRRAQWFFPAAHRFLLRTPVQVVSDDIYEGVTDSLSISGAKILLQRDSAELEAKNKPRVRFVDVIFPEIKNIKVHAEVIQYQENTLRLHFKGLGSKERKYLSAYLESHLETDDESKT